MSDKSSTNTNSSYAFPRDNINPDDKDITWGMDWAKAAYYNYMSFRPRTCFYSSGERYEEQKLYALGMAPINKFKKMFGVDEQTNLSWVNIDWTPPHVIGTIRDIAISRMMQQEYDVVATPIDQEAKTELSALYASIRAKIAIREALERNGSDLSQDATIMIRPGEPADEQEFKMRLDFGEQFNRSKDSEEAIKLAMFENDEKVMRRQWFEDWFDWGVAGYDTWSEPTTYKAKARRVNCESVISNYCRKPDFADQHYAGEVLDVDLVDLAKVTKDNGDPMFTDDMLTQLANDVAGRYGNPTILGRTSYYFKGFDRFKVKVLSLRWRSWNDLYYNQWNDGVGNPQFEFKKYATAQNTKRQYKSKRYEVIYEIKWVIGTDYAYDFRMRPDQARSNDPGKTTRASLGYRFFAHNFYEMRAESMMERLIPIADQYYMDWYRVQNFKNRMVPQGWWIDLDGLENAALEHAGKNLTALQLLDMFFQTGVLVGRTKDIMGDPNMVNYKPVMPLQNSMFQELAALVQSMMGFIIQMKQTVGLNDVTDSTTPPEKMLTPGYESAQAGTNNALYPMQFAEHRLFESLANDLLVLTQMGLKKGPIEGWSPALNSNTLTFLKISPAISLRVYGIMLEEKPTDDQKMFLINQFGQDMANGYLDVSDCIMVLNTYNAKQAAMYLSWKVQQNKKQAQQFALQNQQQVAAMSAQTAQQTAAMQQQLLQLKGQMDMQKTQMMKEMDLRIAAMKTDAQKQGDLLKAQAQVASANISASSKESAPAS